LAAVKLTPGGVVEVAGRPVTLRVNPPRAPPDPACGRRHGRGVGDRAQRAAPPEAADFARRRSDWIAERAAERPDTLPFQPGAVIPLRGREVRLEAAPGSGAARLRGEAIVSGGEGPAYARRVQNLLRREALADLTARTAAHALALGVPAPRITLNDPRAAGAPARRRATRCAIRGA
jgi:hypothetical protein